MILVLETVKDQLYTAMIFLQLYRMTNYNQTMHIPIMQEDTLQAPLRTVNEQSSITWHVSNTILKKKSFDIFAIDKLANEVKLKWSSLTTVVSNTCSMTQYIFLSKP